ncbi:sensor histidine kinase [Arthrobacter ginkgonis]
MPAPHTPGGTPTPGGHGDRSLVLGAMRVGLHVGFAALLAFGVALTVWGTPWTATTWAVLGMSGVLAAVYLAGTLAEKHHAATGRGPDPAPYAHWWLTTVTLLWAGLVLASGAFAWLAFPLFFLHLHLLRPRHAVAAVALLTLTVAASQWWHSGRLEPAMVVGPAVGAVFAVLMGTAYRVLYEDGEIQRRAVEELHSTRTELARSQHEAGALAERARLAGEIHDTVAQGLSSIVLLSRGTARALEAGDPEGAVERLRLVESSASDNLAEVRRFVRGLSSPLLDHVEPTQAGPETTGPLAPSLRRLCASTEQRSAASGRPLQCRFVLEGNPVPLPAAYEATLLRAAQASLANVAAHSQARSAVVSLAFLGEDVTLDVYDDGIGFAPARIGPRADGTGYGLPSLRERVAGLDGSLEVESAPGEGAVVAVRLPLAGGKEKA